MTSLPSPPRSADSQVMELDAIARASTPSNGESYDESLHGIEFVADGARFHYVAGTVNTEWWIAFARTDVGEWVYRGLA